MPLYYFNLKDHQGLVPDLEGTELPDDRHAFDHAREVAADLMLNREPRTRSWRLQVCDDQRYPKFELLFATIDNTMNHLVPEWRAMVETTSSRSAALVDAIADVRMTLHQIRGTIAQADGKPYLAAADGIRICEA